VTASALRNAGEGASGSSDAGLFDALTHRRSAERYLNFSFDSFEP
jgi:hypothetical protein